MLKKGVSRKFFLLTDVYGVTEGQHVARGASFEERERPELDTDRWDKSAHPRASSSASGAGLSLKPKVAKHMLSVGGVLSYSLLPLSL